MGSGENLGSGAMLEVYNYHLRSLSHLHPFHPAQIFAKAINDLTLYAPTGLFGGKPWGKRSGAVTSVGGLMGCRGLPGSVSPATTEAIIGLSLDQPIKGRNTGGVPRLALVVAGGETRMSWGGRIRERCE